MTTRYISSTRGKYKLVSCPFFGKEVTNTGIRLYRHQLHLHKKLADFMFNWIPIHLTENEKALFGQREWYFFTPRDRKYPNGSRTNRDAGQGYCKATGAGKPVVPKGNTRQVGIKKVLVFYAGKALRGIKTNWIMHEFWLAADHHSPSKKGNQRLDEWVLSRLYYKKNSWEKTRSLKPQLPIQKIPVPAVADEGSFGEPGDSYRETDSFHESEIDNAVDHSFHGPFCSLPNQSDTSMQLCFGGMQIMRGNNYEPWIKEDNEWFTGLKLDDLQTTPLEVPGQEFYFPACNSPQLKFNQMPF